MAKRGLADWEISLIKRMMLENYARDKMHAYFNRPERTLTPAAFSEIKAGKFGEDVPPATAEALSRFTESFSKSPAAAASDPIGLATLCELLAVHPGSSRLTAVEDGHLEFKASFSFHENTVSKVVRAMAALANSAGGYILCGVEDGTGQLLGLSAPDQFACDLARWSQLLRSCLMPVPVFERTVVDVAGVKIGVIYIEASTHKPVVATRKLGEKVRSGGIYYRYPGQSAEIAYGELSALLSDRDRRAQQGLLGTLNVIAERGTDDVAVIDLKEGRIIGADSPVELSREFVDALNIIRTGEFVEQGGMPTIRIVAEATVKDPANDLAPQVVRGYVSDKAAMRNFAHRQTVREPLQYFLASLNSPSDWLPVFRWLREAGVSRQQAAILVENESLTPAKRRRALQRLAGERTARLPLAKSVRQARHCILGGDLPAISSATELRRNMQAIRMVEYADAEKLGFLWQMLGAGYDFAWAAENGGDLQSYVKAAAARVDELAEQLAQRCVEAA